jgi:hypothetical protein
MFEKYTQILPSPPASAANLFEKYTQIQTILLVVDHLTHSHLGTLR